MQFIANGTLDQYAEKRTWSHFLIKGKYDLRCITQIYHYPRLGLP